jgi:hypothetical protein
MASKKPSVGEKAAQFLAAIGTAGGPIGSPALVGFGATNLAQQVQSGNVDEYAAVRGAGLGPVVGDPRAPQPVMAQNLDASYLKLNLPGSPLPANGLFTDRAVKATQITQDQMLASEQLMMTRMMPMTGQLPMGIVLPQPQAKGRR